ncbi:MAG: hypothetical protein NDJ75_00535 [Thermoanaerobaculia bacterium]|nr:hypothetical protein [Thermoanaerobaculia bacterium]
MTRATAWCRVDFGGGTLDIWPLGVMHPGSVTVNLAVDLPVSAELVRRERGYAVRQDGATHEADDLAGLLGDAATALPALAALELGLPPVEMRLTSASPRGAGLGASSALAVALLAAGELLRDGELTSSATRRARVARDLEARLMGLPTGMQDHLPGQLGGALAIEHHAGGDKVRRLAVDLDALAARLIVAYTGQSHFSAGNNWAVLRRRFEGDADTVERLDAVGDVARRLPSALEAGAWPEVGRLIASEWEARRGLAPEVDSPRIERLLARAGELGAWGGKACGAGGGGSIVVLAPPERRAAILAEFAVLGAEILPASPTARGLETQLEGA